MTTTAHRGEARVVATLAAGGAVLGFVLAASRSGADGCASAAHRVGGCVPGALVAARPLVSAAVVGFLLGVLIAVAAVLAWREARLAVATLERRPATPPRRSPAVRAQRRTSTPH